MKIELRVYVDGMFWNGGATMVVPELHTRCFDPLKTCDKAIAAYVTGDVLVAECRIVMKTRADAADIMARELSRMIVREMEKNDTHNGYLKEDV